MALIVRCWTRVPSFSCPMWGVRLSLRYELHPTISPHLVPPLQLQVLRPQPLLGRSRTLRPLVLEQHRQLRPRDLAVGELRSLLLRERGQQLAVAIDGKGHIVALSVALSSTPTVAVKRCALWLLRTSSRLLARTSVPEPTTPPPDVKARPGPSLGWIASRSDCPLTSRRPPWRGRGRGQGCRPPWVWSLS